MLIIILNFTIYLRAVAAIVILIATLAAAYEDQCPKEQEQDWSIEKLLRHEVCNKFYKCTFGVPVEMVCPHDLFFNLATWQCDWQHNVDCTDRIVPDEFLPSTSTPVTNPPTTTTSTTITPTTTTTTRPVPTTTTTTSTTTLAPTTSTTTTTTSAPTTTTTTTTTTPVPTTTTTTTLAPTTTTTTTTPAPTTTTTTTTTPPPITTTSTTTTPAPATTSSTTTSNLTPTTQAPTPGPEDGSMPDLNSDGCPVNPHVHWLIPHEEDCNLFYYCVWGERVLRECPPTTHFNRVLQVCDFPYRAGCINSFNKHLESRRVLLTNT